MTDIASLGIKVTSEGIPQATTGLEQLAKSGAKAEQEVAKVAPAMQQASKSAKELSAATRALPAQITDIVSGLASGQRPLQVLFQQGGQLKDMFGGVRPAIAAVGTELTALLNPATLAAGALAGLYLAYEGGASEARAFEQALITTGGAIGVTVGQLQDMSRELGASTAGQHDAAKALAEVAASGKFTGEQIGLVAKAALDMERATGQAVGETVKQFAKLGDEPVQAALKLNEQYHFLTLEVYEQIKTLDEQGRTLDASTLAMDAASRAAERMATDTRANLGLLQSAWKEVTDSAKFYLDLLLEIGRAPSPNEKIEASNKRIIALQDRLSGKAPLSFGQWDDGRVREQLRMEQENFARLVREQEKAGTKAGEDAAKARLVTDRASADAELARYQSKEQRLADEKIRIHGEFAQRIANARNAGDKTAAAQFAQDEKAAIAGLEAQYATRKPRERKARERKAVDEIGPIVARIQQQTAILDAQAVSEDKLTAVQRLRVTIMQQLEQLGSKVTAADRERIDIALKEADAAEQSAIANEKAREAREKDAEARKKQAEAAGRVIDDLQFEIDLIGKSRLEQAQMIALRQAGVDANSEYGESIKELVKRQAELVEQQELIDGVRASAEDMFASFIDGSKSASEAFEDFAKDLQRIAARLLAQKAVEWLFSTVSGAGGMGTSTGGNADGGWWMNLFGGGRASGGSTKAGKFYEVNERGPELYNTGGRTYLMTGARDGFVTPATTASFTSGGGGGSSAAPGVTVIVENHGNGQARTEETTGPDGGRMIKVIVEAAVSEVDRRIGTMGSTGRAIQGRFGVSPAGASRG